MSREIADKKGQIVSSKKVDADKKDKIEKKKNEFKSPGPGS